MALPERSGFGARLIVETPKRILNAAVDLWLDPDGIFCDFDSLDDVVADPVQLSA